MRGIEQSPSKSLDRGSKLAYRAEKVDNFRMANVEKVSVALTPEMAAMMRSVVDAGEYASASEVMREALREWKFRRTQRERAIDELGRLWDDGIASGPAVDGAQALSRIRSRLEDKLAGRNIS